jgi:Uncharacterised nucleotidyltransferase
MDLCHAREQLLGTADALAALDLAGWDRLLRAARASNLLSRLALQVQAAGIVVPDPVRPHLQAARVLAQHQREAVGWECRRLADALEGLQLPRVLLKGAAYALEGLQAAEGRLFGDIDVLVPADQIDEVERALRFQGWFMAPISAYDQQFYRRWTHERPPLTHAQRHTSIDLHHNILPPAGATPVSAPALLAAAVPIPGHPGWSRLCDADVVLHSAAHLYHEGETRHALRDLCDLDALLREMGQRPDFWPQLASRASTLGLSWCLALALRHTARWLQTPIDPAVRAQAESDAGWGRLRRNWADAVYERAFRPSHTAGREADQYAAQWWLYIRGHHLRLPAGVLARHLVRKAWHRSTSNRAVRL